VVFLEPAAVSPQINVDLSVSLLPALMPLLARLRHLLDLDAEPAVIDAHLADAGLAALVARRPGLRLPGALDGFEVAARELLRSDMHRRVTNALGESFPTGLPALGRLGLTADRVADAGAPSLSMLGVPSRRGEAVAAVARAVSRGTLCLEPGADVHSTMGALTEIPGLGARTAEAIVMRALHWPDAFPSTDASLQRAAGATGTRALLRIAERWRPWRGYAAAHLSSA
jgi:AraC family transcriptional regulator of adaptative response / DNA-3-methyladenine glycosylase II